MNDRTDVWSYGVVGVGVDVDVRMCARTALSSPSCSLSRECSKCTRNDPHLLQLRSEQLLVHHLQDAHAVYLAARVHHFVFGEADALHVLPRADESIAAAAPLIGLFFI